MKKILIVGAGGIGSHLAHNIHTCITINQFPSAVFTIADNDTVDKKNLTYQKFSTNDLLENKAEVLGKKYNFNYISKRIEKESELLGYDCIVGAADNTIFRKLLYANEQHYYWIDLRCIGTAVSIYAKSKNNTYTNMLKTLPKTDVLTSSCQHKWELDQNIVQLGNKIIATIGCQYLLNWYRITKNISRFECMF